MSLGFFTHMIINYIYNSILIYKARNSSENVVFFIIEVLKFRETFDIILIF